jgi:lambda family phage tail tape measure protein
MANIIAGLGAQLGLDTTEFKKGISEAKSSLKELKEYLPEILSVAAFVEMTRASMEMANQIMEVAKANEIAVKSVLELSKALEENGGSAEETGKIYSGFTQKVEVAAQGNAKAQESFQRLGVSLNDLRHLSEQELFEKTITGLANMKDAAERNGLAYQTLGKAIRGVDIVGLAHTMEESKGTMDRFAVSIEQAHELSLKLKESSHNLSLEFTNAVMPSLNTLYDSLMKTGNAVHYVFQGFKYLMEGLSVAIQTVVTGGKQLFDVLMGINSYIAKILTGKWSEANAELAKGWDNAKQHGIEYLDFLHKLIEANDESAKPKARVQEGPINRAVTDSLQSQLTKAGEIAEAYKKQAQANYLVVASQLAANEATKNQKQLQEELMKVVEARNKALDEIDKQMAAVDKTVSGHQRIIKVLEEQKVKIQQTYGVMIVETEKAVLANQAFQESFSYGWQKAFQQFKENSMNAADVGKQTFDSLMNNMTSALDNFVKTGKLNFKSLAQSIISDLIAIQIKAQATSLFGKAGESLGLGNLFGGGGIGSAGGGGDAEILSMFGFADGGDPPVGQVSMVGERGPELFVPKQAGTIIPNNMLGSMGNNQPSITYNGPYIANMSAIDTQSATQFLAKNKSAVWAANQTAQRSLPQSR